MKKLIPIILTTCFLTALLILSVIPAFAETAKDISTQISDNLPVQFDTSIDMFEVEDVFDEDGSGYNHNTHSGGFDYYFLKGEYGKTYMTLKFTVEQSGTYDFCIGLMAIGSSVPRTCEFDVNGEERYYVSRLYNNLGNDEVAAEYITDITAYLREGENKITFYSGYDFDNVNVKSVFIDKVFYHRTGDLPQGYKFPDDGSEEETVDITGAEPTVVKFNSNFKSIVTAAIYCKYDYVDDDTYGNVMRCTITEDVNTPLITFSYSKYLKLLGLDANTETCDEYACLVLTIKSDANISDGWVKFYSFTDGNTVLDESASYEEYYNAGEGWQYVILGMDETNKWSGVFNGGSFLVAKMG